MRKLFTNITGFAWGERLIFILQIPIYLVIESHVQKDECWNVTLHNKCEGCFFLSHSQAIYHNKIHQKLDWCIYGDRNSIPKWFVYSFYSCIGLLMKHESSEQCGFLFWKSKSWILVNNTRLISSLQQPQHMCSMQKSHLRVKLNAA